MISAQLMREMYNLSEVREVYNLRSLTIAIVKARIIFDSDPRPQKTKKQPFCPLSQLSQPWEAVLMGPEIVAPGSLLRVRRVTVAIVSVCLWRRRL